MNDGEDVWIAFLLKDKYASDFEKRRMRDGLMSQCGYDADDIRYAPFQRGNSISYYFFIRDKGESDPQPMSRLYYECLDAYSSQGMRLSESDVDTMMSHDDRCRMEAVVKFGDVVRIRTGRYRGLFGIVLRNERKMAYSIGMKFGFGVVILNCEKVDFTVVDNVFKYIKVPK